MKTVLAVDDSSTMRMAVSLVLKNLDYDVITANDGRDALEKMRQSSRVNLIITDLNMPNMDGITFIKETRKMVRYDSTPILILTTESDNEKKKLITFIMTIFSLFSKRSTT